MAFFHEVLVSAGAERCEAAPQFYKGRRADCKSIRLEVHMDDFYGSGSLEEAPAFLGELCKSLDLKIFYHKVGGPKFNHLKRERQLLEDCIQISPNPRYLKGVMQQLNLVVAKAVTTPTAIGQQPEEGDEEFLDPAGSTHYRSAVGSLAYFAIDRQDVQYEVNALAKKMSAPTVGRSAR